MILKSPARETPDHSSKSTSEQSRPEKRCLPLVGIVGAAGKTTTGWLLTYMIEASGREVGAWLTSGVYVDHQLRSDELHAWELAVMAARAREVQVLVQEIPSVLAGRLSPGSLRMAVITAICGSDAACRRDDAAARDREAVINAIQSLHKDGITVANADDLLVVDALETGKPDHIYYALHEANPVLRTHLDLEGRACWVQDGWIVCRFGENFERIVPTTVIPATLDGHLSYQIQNALAATAAALALGIEIKFVRDVLRAFSPSSDRQPASSNILELNGSRVLLDRPRSTWALKHLARSVRATTAKRVLSVVDTLQQFSEADLPEAGRLIGASSGVVVIYASGTDNATRVQALRAGLMACDAPPVILSRDETLTTPGQVVSMLQPGDTGLILIGESSLTAYE